MAACEEVDGVLLVVTVTVKEIKQGVEAEGSEVVCFGGLLLFVFGTESHRVVPADLELTM